MRRTRRVSIVVGAVLTTAGSRLGGTRAGMPLVSYAGGSHPGDVTGPAVGGIRWGVGADGAELAASPAPPPAVPGY